MGTRADFYVGRGPTAQWIGSIAWDGYWDGIDPQILHCTSEAAYRHAVAAFLASRDDAAVPDQGWPWPWHDSGTTDCVYAFDDGRVWQSIPGDGAEDYWIDGQHAPPRDDAGDALVPEGALRCEWPDMHRQARKLPEARPRNQPITPQQQAAWEAFAEVMGEDRMYLDYASLRTIVDAGLEALIDAAAARPTNSAARSNPET